MIILKNWIKESEEPRSYKRGTFAVLKMGNLLAEFRA